MFTSARCSTLNDVPQCFGIFLIFSPSFWSQFFIFVRLIHVAETWQTCFIRPASLVPQFVMLWWKRWEWDLWPKVFFSFFVLGLQGLSCKDNKTCWPFFWNGIFSLLFFFFHSLPDFNCLFGKQTTCLLTNCQWRCLYFYSHVYSLHVFFCWCGLRLHSAFLPQPKFLGCSYYFFSSPSSSFTVYLVSASGWTSDA